MKLFFEAGTVSAADESVVAPRHRPSLATAESHPRRSPRTAGAPTRPSKRTGKTRRGTGPARASTPLADTNTSGAGANASGAGINAKPTMMEKPVTMEWDEWALAFQNEPITIDYGSHAQDDATTTPDLSLSGIRSAWERTPPSAEAEQPNETSEEHLRTLTRSFVDGTKRTL